MSSYAHWHCEAPLGVHQIVLYNGCVFFGWDILEEGVQNLFFAYQAALVLQWMQNAILLLLSEHQQSRGDLQLLHGLLRGRDYTML